MQHPPVLPPDVQTALTRGEKIEAIKLLRGHWGLGLKEAKDLVDAEVAHPGSRGAAGNVAGRAAAVVAARRDPPTHLAPGEQPRRARRWLWSALIAGVAAAWYFGFIG